MLGLAEAGAVFKIAESVWKGGEKATSWLTNEGPLVMQIIDSKQDSGRCTVTLRALNIAFHSIELVAFHLKWPANEKIDMVVGRGMDFRGKGSSEPPAKLLHPGEKVDFTIHFNTPDSSVPGREAGTLGKLTRLGLGELSFWILNEEEPRTREVEFVVRIPKRA
jgi:hypothetical protein